MGILSKFLPSRKPKPSVTPFLSDDIAYELPIGFDSLASAFPVFKDPVYDELNRDGYRKIRRTDVTAQPMLKLANRVASLELTVSCDDPTSRQVLQHITDRIPKLPNVIKELTWAIIEGVVFAWIRGRTENGLAIPVLSTRKKYKAGGLLRFDGANVIKVREYAKAGVPIEEDVLRDQTLDRSRVIVYRPDANTNPEGDGDLAWMLYRLADAAEINDKNLALYADRFGVPREMMRKYIEGVRPDQVQPMLTASANRMDNLKRQPGAMDIKDILEIIEPGGTTSNYLMEYRKSLEMRAHKLILMNTLTSETSQAGPTGSSGVHKTEEDILVSCIADTVAEAFSEDLLPWIIKYNGHRLRKGVVAHYEFTPPTEQVNVSPDQALALYNSGEGVDSTWLYARFGAPKPDGTPTVIQGSGSVSQDVGGFGGFGGFGLRKKLNVAEEEADSIVRQASKDLTSEMNKTYLSLIKQFSSGKSNPRAPQSLAFAIAKIKALAHLAGIARMTKDTTRLKKRNLSRCPRVDHTRQLQDIVVDIQASTDLPFEEAVNEFISREPVLAPTVEAGQAVADEVARLYRSGRFTVVRVIEATMLKNIQSRLSTFLINGGDQRDFVSYMVEQDPERFSEAYAETVFRNNVNTAYNAGRQAKMENLVKEGNNLGWEYVTAGDSAVRPSHALLDGKVFRGSNKLMPPNGHNCRCTFAVVDLDTIDASQIESDSTVAQLSTQVFEDNPGWDRAPRIQVQSETTLP